jgi:hypothetical protein
MKLKCIVAGLWSLAALCSCGATRSSTSGGAGNGAAGSSQGQAGVLTAGGSAGTGGDVTSAGAASSLGGASGAAGSGAAGQCRQAGPPVADLNAKSAPIENIRALPITLPAPPTSCEHPPPSGAGGAPPLGSDACGCAGLTCPDPKVCINAIVEVGAACGQPQRANQCFDTCARDSDCQNDEICLPVFDANEVPLCFKAGCRSGSDCCSGNCRVSTGYFSQCHQNVVLQIDCQ